MTDADHHLMFSKTPQQPNGDALESCFLVMVLNVVPECRAIARLPRQSHQDRIGWTNLVRPSLLASALANSLLD